MKPLRIAIVGYGTAGQASAALLARDGHELDVFEQAPSLGPVGAGLLLQPTGLEILWRLGLMPQALQHGAKIRRLHGCNQRGRRVMDMRYADLDARLFGLGMQRGALFALLRSAWPNAAAVRCGIRIVTADVVDGRLRDAHGGEYGPYDLVIAADGAASLLRGTIGGAQVDQAYPWGAVWCLCPAGDWQPIDELRQRYVAARKMIGLLPVGTRPGDPEPRLSFFWSLPTDRFGAWEAIGMDMWKRDIAQLWPEVLPRLEGITVMAHLAPARYRDAVLPQWQRGRLVLVGDAAHAMSPQLGQGVNMALMDAWALGAALRGAPNIASALQRYEHERRAHTAIYQFWSRWLTPLFQSDRDRIAGLRDLLLRPLGQLPGGRGTMLRVLSGTQHGFFGKYPLSPEFLATLE